MGPYRAKSLEQRFWNPNVEGLQHWKLGQDDSEAVKTLLGCVVHFLQRSSPVFRCNQGPKAGGRESSSPKLVRSV